MPEGQAFKEWPQNTCPGGSAVVISRLARKFTEWQLLNSTRLWVDEDKVWRSKVVNSYMSLPILYGEMYSFLAKADCQVIGASLWRVHTHQYQPTVRIRWSLSRMCVTHPEKPWRTNLSMSYEPRIYCIKQKRGWMLGTRENWTSPPQGWVLDWHLKPPWAETSTTVLLAPVHSFTDPKLTSAMAAATLVGIWSARAGSFRACQSCVLNFHP